MAGEFVIKSEGGKKQLIINYKGAPYGADIAQYAACMKDVIEKLREADADEVVLSEYYEKIYNEEQVGLLRGISDLIQKLEAETVWSPTNLGQTMDSKLLAPRHEAVMQFLDMLPGDPFRAYMFILQEIKTQMARASSSSESAMDDLKVYLRTLGFIKTELENTALISAMKKYLLQLSSIPADRNIYRSFFEAAIKPSFIGSRIFFTGAENLQLIDQYEVIGTKVHIYKHPEKVELLYYINPPEYTLPPDKYFLLEKTKEVVSTHRPASVSFLDMQQARKYFKKIYMGTINDLATRNNVKIAADEKDELATIVSRYTIGYGIMEILLSDRQLTDVYVDSPLGEKPIYLVHSKYGQCQTNVIFSEEEAKSLVSRFRALSGRPFDEAHPILDFDLPDLQTRIATIGKPLAVDGTAFALRLHKETPWTLAQFLDFRMFNSLTAGLLSFMVDAQASMLIVGSRGAGKCLDKNSSLQLGDGNLAPIGEVVESCLSRSQNLIMLDDGVCADLKQNNLNLEVISMDSDLKLKKVLVEKVWRRNAPSKMLKFEFASGKQIMVTAEHPFFTLSDAQMIMKRADNFSTGEYVASPRELKVANEYQKISMLHPSLKYIGCEEPISESIRGMQWEQPLTFVATDSKTSYRTLRNLKEGVRKSIFLSEIKTICMHSGQDPDSYISRFTHAVAGTSSLQMPFHRHLLLDEGFARFLGLLMGDGHLDEHKIEFTNTNADIRNEFGRLATDIFGVRGRTIVPSERSPNYQITCKPLYYLLKDNVGIIAGDKASTQAIPEKILLSPNSTLAAFIGGYFDCDSSVSLNNNEIEFSSASQAIANQMQLALQRFGIVSTLKTKLVGGVSYYRLFIRGENAAKFAKTIPMHHPEKMLRLKKILSADSFNSNIDIVPNSWNLLKACKAKFGIGKTSLDQHNLTQRVLQRLHSKLVARGLEKESLSDSIKKLAFNDVFWDRIVSIQEIPYGEKHVYDLTVGGTHSFVANGVIVHNTSMLQAMMQEIPQNLRIIVQEDTLELPVHSLKHLGFSIQRLKTRAPLGMQSEAEVSAEDALRTALRLGDSVLIVGEVRSGEAKALFEAMRVGAVGNVVMGTIHGESAYSIWDRIVNDLGVPTTSFKATDFAIVATQIRFKGSLKRARRLIEITEVKKHWTQDPDKEDGFLNWMMFDAGKDDLDFFEDKLKESEWLEKLQKTRGLKLEQIWAEIRARAEAKQYLVDLKRKYSIPKLLEAENTLPAHSRYMLYSEQQREEHGGVDHKQLIKDWKLWVDDYLAKPLLKK